MTLLDCITKLRMIMDDLRIFYQQLVLMCLMVMNVWDFVYKHFQGIMMYIQTLMHVDTISLFDHLTLKLLQEEQNNISISHIHDDWSESNANYSKQETCQRIAT